MLGTFVVRELSFYHRMIIVLLSVMNHDSFYSTPTTQLINQNAHPVPPSCCFTCFMCLIPCLFSDGLLSALSWCLLVVNVCCEWHAVNGMPCFVCSLVLHEIRSLWWSVPLVKCLSCWCWLPPAGVLSCSVPHGVYASWRNRNRSAVSDSSKSYICDFIDSYSLPMSTLDVQSLDAWLTKPKPLSGFSFVSFVFFHGTM